MNFSIKNTLTLFFLFFTCFSLRSSELAEEDPYPVEYTFWEKEDCIKIRMVFPVGTIANSTLYKINNPDPNGVSIRIKNDQLDRLETFYQLVDVEVHAVSFPEEGGVMFEIIENLERKPDSNKITSDKYTGSAKYFVKTDKQVNLRKDVLPRLTFSGGSPDTKYLRFFTKP